MSDCARSAVAARFRSGRSLAAEFTPTSRPSRSKTPPPESPGLSGASIASSHPSRPITRPTRSGGGRHGERSGPSGCPSAITGVPVESPCAAPSSTNGRSRPAASIFTRPTSPSGPKCWPYVRPFTSVPSASSTFTSRPGACPTWPAVSTQPSAEMMVPLPDPASGAPGGAPGAGIRIPTTDSRTRAATSRTRDSSARRSSAERISNDPAPAPGDGCCPNAVAGTHATTTAARSRCPARRSVGRAMG